MRRISKRGQEKRREKCRAAHPSINDEVVGSGRPVLIGADEVRWRNATGMHCNKEGDVTEDGLNKSSNEQRVGKHRPSDHAIFSAIARRPLHQIPLRLSTKNRKCKENEGNQ